MNMSGELSFDSKEAALDYAKAKGPRRFVTERKPASPTFAQADTARFRHRTARCLDALKPRSRYALNDAAPGREVAASLRENFQIDAATPLRRELPCDGCVEN